MSDKLEQPQSVPLPYITEPPHDAGLKWLDVHNKEHDRKVALTGYYLGYIVGCVATNDAKQAAENVFKVLYGATSAEQEEDE